MKNLQTQRLSIRKLTTEDSDFILRLVNDPDWLKYIGDKGVRNRQDAEAYIRSGPLRMYEEVGFGLCLVELASTAEAIGICGLIQRPSLPHADLGFAFLPQFRGQGLAYESARAVLQHGLNDIGLSPIAAITLPDNRASIRLLEKLGFSSEGRVRMNDDDSELMLYLIRKSPVEDGCS